MSGGRMLQVGTPKEIYETPATAEVAAFVGRCNFLEASIVGLTDSGAVVSLAANGQSITVKTDLNVQVGHAVTVAIRPERLRVCALEEDRTEPGVNRLIADVLTVSYLGSRYEYDLKLGDYVVQVVCDRGGLTGPVRLAVEPDACLLFHEADVLSDEAQALLTVAS
jgi:iron(III) transport system ATP-binding protein